MQLTVNGLPLDASPRDGASLLELLRDELGLRSLKDGCAPEGSCGACTVIVDGRAVVSCAQPAARFENRSVTTLEGLSAASRAEWAHAFIAQGASQCGYCTPGIVMKAEALLVRTPQPSEPDLRRALAGNLCRCTGYQSILSAMADVAQRRAAGNGAAAAGLDTAAQGVGADAPRLGGQEQVLGEQLFVADMVVPGMLHGAIRFSDHPRATVRHIDVRAAAALPGVARVVTWRDVPGERHQGLLEADWPLFVAEGETTRYVGDMIAAVAAESRDIARTAAGLIEIDYDVLPPVADMQAALAADAPAIHAGGNLLSTSVVRRGDADAALSTAAHVASGVFTTQRIEHAFLEPEAALCVPAGRRRPPFRPGTGSVGGPPSGRRRCLASARTTCA